MISSTAQYKVTGMAHQVYINVGLRMMLEYKTKNAKKKNMSLCYKVCM